MRALAEMTVEEMRAEMAATWEKLSAIPEAEYDDTADDATRDRFHSLSAEIHARMMADETLDGAIYRARGGDAPSPKRTI